MRTKSHRLSAAFLALALVGVGGAASAEQKSAKITPKNAVDGAKVIALQTWVENLTAANEARFGLAPNSETIPVNVGDRVRVRLVGTMIEADGDGVEVPVAARFSEAPGTSQLDILERGSNWVVVRIADRDRQRNDGRAQLAYEVTGRYDLKQNMQSGRITFDLGGRGSSAVGTDLGVTDRERWRHAERVAAVLYDGILNMDASALRLASGYQEDVEQIYREGYQGVVQVAMDLARDSRERDVFRSLSANDVAAHLYRVLLGRSGSASQLRGDAGFVSNVRLLEREGLEDLVETIVRSEEFHQVHEMTRLASAR
ncbi:MAG TPA: hypothetical protein VF121_17890 [Thermoanaerobaculia bacterium]|nr:hypothetical protein [Thermoanaerobaculia bacterium]